MKQKISVSIEEKTIQEIREIVSKGSFRNNSHLIEFAINKLLEKRDER
jgi:Arc/MetJ-type ribon-helix-helix transcriptional regulator